MEKEKKERRKYERQTMWHGSEISNVSINTTRARFLEIFFVIRYTYRYHDTKGIPRENLAPGKRRISNRKGEKLLSCLSSGLERRTRRRKVE